MNQPDFKIKDFEKLHDPEKNAPKFLNMMLMNQVEVLDIKKSNILSNGLEMYSYILGKNKIAPCSSLRILNLSQNRIASEGAKILASALKKNKSLVFLDLS